MRLTLKSGAALAALLVIAGCSTPKLGGAPSAKATDPSPVSILVAPLAKGPNPNLPTGLGALRPEDVELVKDLPPIGPGSDVARPLYGARPEDRPWLQRLLHALSTATPADPTGADGQHRRMAWTEIRLKGGRVLQIRDAWNCNSTDGGVSCQTVPGKQVIAEGEKRWVVSSPELDSFLHAEHQAAMPPVNRFVVAPGAPRAGGPLTVSGEGWGAGKTYKLYLVQDGSNLPLGEGSVTFGALRWEGTVPADLASGTHQLNLEVNGEGTIGITLPVTR